MVGKDLFVLTNVFLNNSHCTNHLQCSLPFLCKIQVREHARSTLRLVRTTFVTRYVATKAKRLERYG